MTKIEMLEKLRANKGKSVGVEVTTHEGKEICFFYKDEKESSGITRAMKEVYPLMNSGKYTKVTFVA